MHMSHTEHCHLYFQRQSATNITFQEAWDICDQEFTKCGSAESKDTIDTDYNKTVEDCAKDVMVW